MPLLPALSGEEQCIWMLFWVKMGGKGPGAARVVLLGTRQTGLLQQPPLCSGTARGAFNPLS